VIVSGSIWLNGFIWRIASVPKRGRLAWSTAALVVLGLNACSLGRTRIEQTYFLAVPSDKNVSYFRVRISGNAVLGQTEFRSGWFPGDAVDSLYGDTSQNGATEAYRLKEQLKAKYDAAILKTTEGYLNAAADPKTGADIIQSWLLAQRRVRATAGTETQLPQGAVEIEYDPGRGLTTLHAGEKLVLVLASDPTTVIEAISAFSKDVQTGATVMNLADVIRQQSANDVATTEARNESRAKSDALIAQRLGTMSDLLKTNPKRADLIREIESVRILLENYR